MKTISVGRFGQARLWLDEPAGASVEGPSVARRRVRAGTLRPSRQTVVIEAAIPRGARVEYGLLGITSAEGGDELLVEVPTSPSGPVWQSPLVVSSETATVGVPQEYADAILDAIEETAAGRIRPGLLRISQAAFGLVGSSPNFITKLAKLTIEVMLADGPLDSVLDHMLARILL